MRHHQFGFECASCGTVRLEIPEDVQELTLIRCAKCRAVLGQWGTIQDIFLGELGNGIFDLTDGQISAVPWQPRPFETRIQMALRHVREGAERIARQRQLVGGLRRAGYPADTAERLLAIFEETQVLHVRHLERLVSETTRRIEWVKTPPFN